MRHWQKSVDGRVCYSLGRWISWLPCNPEDLSSDLQHPHDSQAWQHSTHLYAHTQHGCGRDGRLPGAHWSDGVTKWVSQVLWETVSKNRVKSDWRRHTRWNSGFSLCAPQHPSAYIHTISCAHKFLLVSFTMMLPKSIKMMIFSCLLYSIASIRLSSVTYL